MLIDLTLVALILLVLLYADRYAAVYLFGAVLAYRLLQFPFDIAIGFVLLQVAMAVARVERPRDGALGALSPEGGGCSPSTRGGSRPLRPTVATGTRHHEL